MKIFIKITALLIAILIALTSFAGCAKDIPQSNPNADTSNIPNNDDNSSDGSNDPEEDWKIETGVIKGEYGSMIIDATYGADYKDQPIDIYIIAGQSNGSGYSRYTDAFSSAVPSSYANIYYSGTGDASSSLPPSASSLKSMRIGLGATSAYIGPELGMASVLSSYYNETTGKKAGIIKYASGGTSLNDRVDGTHAQKGTWTPPSYISKNGSYGENSGGLYRNLLLQVKKSVYLYESHGYSVNIKGIYWMQGENDSQQGNAAIERYEDLLKKLIVDMRTDLGKVVGSDLSKIPFLVGEISATYRLNREKRFSDLIAAQNRAVSKSDDAYIIDNSVLGVGTDATDPSHWTVDDAYYIGKQVAIKLLNLNYALELGESAAGALVAEVFNAQGSSIGKYASFAYAANSAPDGATIKLLSDITLYGNLNINNDKKITIDGNGHKITSYSVTHGIRLLGTDIAFKNFTLEHKTDAEAAYGLYTYNSAKATFENCNINAYKHAIVVDKTSASTVSIPDTSDFTVRSGNTPIVKES